MNRIEAEQFKSKGIIDSLSEIELIGLYAYEDEVMQGLINTTPVSMDEEPAIVFNGRHFTNRRYIQRQGPKAKIVRMPHQTNDNYKDGSFVPSYIYKAPTIMEEDIEDSDCKTPAIEVEEEVSYPDYPQDWHSDLSLVPPTIRWDLIP